LNARGQNGGGAALLGRPAAARLRPSPRRPKRPTRHSPGVAAHV